MEQKKNFKEKLKTVGKYFKSILFPCNIKCAFCGEELNGTEMNCTCLNCLNSLPFIKKSCPRCGGEIAEENSGVCIDCKINNYPFKNAYAVFNYTDSPLTAIHKLKYNGKKYLTKPLAQFLAQRFAIENVVPDIVTSIPLHSDKLKQRRFNQSELLAQEFCLLTGYTYCNLCEKVINTPSQTSLSFTARKDNVKDSFKLIKQHKHEIKNKTILVIDHVFTTGATSSEICKTLLDSGAKEGYVLTLAHVNLKNINPNN